MLFINLSRESSVVLLVDDLMTSEFSLPITSLYISIYIQGGRGPDLWDFSILELCMDMFLYTN